MTAVPESLRNYRIDLVEAIDREIELGHRRIPRRRRFEWRAASVVVAFAAATLLALTVAEPWRGSPTILDRAQAGLLAPAGGQILYESVTVHLKGPDKPEPVTRVRLWLDSSTHRFRMMFSGPRQVVVGGTLESSTGLNYVPSANALYRAAFQFRVRQSDLDPAAFIKTALSSGRAKLIGKAMVRGHQVIVIRLSTWFNGTYARLLKPIALYYVDADTYRPVRVVAPPPDGPVVLLAGNAPRDRYVGPENLNGSRMGFPMDPGTFLAGFPGYPALALPGIPTRPVPGPKPYLVYDFERYRLLASTAANQRLTSVRAVYDDVASYAAGFRAASTPLFKALDAKCPFALSMKEFASCEGQRVAKVRTAISSLLRYVIHTIFPASSLPWTKPDLRRLVVSLRSLQRGYTRLAALVGTNDYLNPSRFTGAEVAFYKAILDLEVDIPELRLRIY